LNPPSAAASETARAEASTLADLLHEMSPDLDAVEAAIGRIASPPAGYVRDLVNYVRGFGGKRLRPALVTLSGRAIDPSAVGEVHARVGAVVELIHTATLVHDDILDGSLLRRNRKTLHQLEGPEVAVLLGDFLLASAYAEAASLEDRFASRYLSKITRTVCQGEVLQVHNRGNLDLPESDYLEIIEKKTAVLYAASCEVGARYAGGEGLAVRALHDFGMGIGMAFQIVDDVLDLTGDEAVVGKSLGTDLDRCKMTLPLIHFLREGPTEAVARVRKTLVARRGGAEAGMIRKAVAEAGSVEFARTRAERFVADGVASLAVLPASPAKDTLRRIAGYVLARRR
jgi:octaprenyl-diphosphate synthase